MSWANLRAQLGVTLRPIERWPQPPTTDREASPFRATLGDTIKLLIRELRMLSARNVVLQIAIREGGFRQDGLPRADARAEHPGVILSFDCRHGSLSYPCDRYRDWQCNLRAVALSLEALRAVDRHGVTKRAEQYRGWQALPAGDAAPPGYVAVPGSELEGAARFIANLHPTLTWGSVLKSPVAFRDCYREVVRAIHPDRGGDHDTFVFFEQAAAKLKEHHGI